MEAVQYVDDIAEIEPGKTTVLIKKIVPAAGNEIRAQIRTPIIALNPFTPVEIGHAEVNEEISMDVVENIVRERQHVYRIVMQSGTQYRIWVQNDVQSES
jgi:hypothetical protein